MCSSMVTSAGSDSGLFATTGLERFVMLGWFADTLLSHMRPCRPTGVAILSTSGTFGLAVALLAAMFGWFSARKHLYIHEPSFLSGVRPGLPPGEHSSPHPLGLDVRYRTARRMSGDYTSRCKVESVPMFLWGRDSGPFLFSPSLCASVVTVRSH
jgi:hypothetical protein